MEASSCLMMALILWVAQAMLAAKEKL